MSCGSVREPIVNSVMALSISLTELSLIQGESLKLFFNLFN